MEAVANSRMMTFDLEEEPVRNKEVVSRMLRGDFESIEDDIRWSTIHTESILKHLETSRMEYGVR